MYCVDKSAFEKNTGVEFYSKKGGFFRELAIKSLAAFVADANQQNLSNRELAHRLKGIASTCGSVEAVYLCRKLEQYDELLNAEKVRSLFKQIAISISDDLQR